MFHFYLLLSRHRLYDQAKFVTLSENDCRLSFYCKTLTMAFFVSLSLYDVGPAFRNPRPQKSARLSSSVWNSPKLHSLQQPLDQSIYKHLTGSFLLNNTILEAINKCWIYLCCGIPKNSFLIMMKHIFS